MSQPFVPITLREATHLMGIMVAAAVLDSRDDGKRRVVGVIEHPDHSLQMTTVPEAEAAMKPGFFGGWLITETGEAIPLDLDETH